jgi:6-phosphogluconolactonase
VAQRIEIVATAEEAARRAAGIVAEMARQSVADHGGFTFAVSGGRTPWEMISELAASDLPWDRTEIFQVDERVAPDGHPDRNLTHLEVALATAPASRVAALRPMPVGETDLEAAAARYEAGLPARLDLVHLGLGPDGHTASLVPADPVLDVTDRAVAITGPYQGRRRMTLTYPGLARADLVLWLVTGADKAAALSGLLAGDTSIPASRVTARRSLLIADAAAAGR